MSDKLDKRGKEKLDVEGMDLFSWIIWRIFKSDKNLNKIFALYSKKDESNRRWFINERPENQVDIYIPNI